MKRIGQLLVDQGTLDSQQLDFCLQIQRNNGKSRLGSILCHYRFANPKDVAQALSQQSGWDLFLGDYIVNQEVVEQLTLDYCVSKVVFPLFQEGENAFVLSSGDDIEVTDYLSKTIGGKLKFYVGIEKEIRDALNGLKLDKPIVNLNTPMLDVFNSIINKAIQLSASDVHFEPSLKALEVRFRINGLLRFYSSLSLNQLPAIANIIFHKASITVGDFYHFHDGRFSYQNLGRSVDIRVSHIPSVNGSAIVLRILDKDKSGFALEDLGYGKCHRDLIDQSLIKPDGISLVVGPTGCGKTTTLYAILNHIKSLTTKIITIEDPVEMPLPLATQVQIHEERGISFADTIRAMLRHDPDVMLVGEIRDVETANQAIRAAMTGHKVFATLHTTRAIDAVYRLINLGVDSFLLSQSLRMVIAQRLFRVLCPECKTLKTYSSDNCRSYEKKYLDSKDQSYYAAKGCSKCEHGYLGRSIVAEIVLLDDSMQLALAQGDLSGFALMVKDRDGFISFIEDAKRLLSLGVMSMEEAIRVIG